MSIAYSPLLSIEQQIGNEDMPISYMTNIAGPLASLQSELHWYLHDLSRFHQIMFGDLNKRNIDFDRRYQLFKEEFEKEKSKVKDNEGKEILNYRAAQMGNSFNDEGSVIDRCKEFSDEFVVIGLWATAEKFMGKVYASIEHYQSGTPLHDINVPYRWDQLSNEFEVKSVIFDQLDGYSDANECRVLNNTIKHVGFVNSRLAEFTFFSKLQGQELQKIDFEMQRYYNGISSFIGSLIESGNRILDPDFPY